MTLDPIQLLNLLVSITTIFVAIPTIHLAYRKYGHKIRATCTIYGGQFIAQRISNVVLQNFKDKPETIYRVMAKINNESYIELAKFDEPLILGPYEAKTIVTEPYSALYLNNKPYKPSFFSADIEIQVELSDSLHTCKMNNRPIFKNNLPFVLIRRSGINGTVYNDQVAYILVYSHAGIDKTAFISDSGYFGNQWEMGFNRLKPRDEKITPEEISQFLKLEYALLIPAFKLYKPTESGEVKLIIDHPEAIEKTS